MYVICCYDSYFYHYSIIDAIYLGVALVLLCQIYLFDYYQ